jgi:hypothetical protein
LGHYIAFNFWIDAPNMHARVIEPLFEHEHVAPAALAGLSEPDDVFLAGWALEHFLTQFFSKRIGRKLRHVELAPSSEGDELRYLSKLVERARRHEVTSWTLSPFEHVDEEAGVTWLEAPPLSHGALPRFDAWQARRQKTFIHLVVSFGIATRDLHQRPWKRALRELWPDEYRDLSLGHPLLFVTAQNNPFNAKQTWVRMQSESQIWLREAQALNGLIGAAEADENLARVATVFRTLLASAGASVVEPQVHVNGSRYRAEAERFESAFRSIAEFEVT